jgi:hypothetical protein
MSIARMESSGWLRWTIVCWGRLATLPGAPQDKRGSILRSPPGDLRGRKRRRRRGDRGQQWGHKQRD